MIPAQLSVQKRSGYTVRHAMICILPGGDIFLCKALLVLIAEITEAYGDLLNFLRRDAATPDLQSRGNRGLSYENTGPRLGTALENLELSRALLEQLFVERASHNISISMLPLEDSERPGKSRTRQKRRECPVPCADGFRRPLPHRELATADLR